MIKCMIVGPMSGKPNWNFEAFLEAEQKLSGLGVEFISAARIFADADMDNPPSWEYCMEVMAVELQKANMLIALPGWEASKGTVIEIKTAFEKNIKVFEYEGNELLIKDFMDKWKGKGDI